MILAMVMSFSQSERLVCNSSRISEPWCSTGVSAQREKHRQNRRNKPPNSAADFPTTRVVLELASNPNHVTVNLGYQGLAVLQLFDQIEISISRIGLTLHLCQIPVNPID